MTPLDVLGLRPAIRTPTTDRRDVRLRSGDRRLDRGGLGVGAVGPAAIRSPSVRGRGPRRSRLLPRRCTPNADTPTSNGNGSRTSSRCSSRRCTRSWSPPAARCVARWMPARRIAGRAIAAVLAVVLIAASARTLMLETRRTRAVWVAGEPALDWSVVRSPLSQLAKRPALDRLKAVNVDLSPWDTVWAAYFLEPTTHVLPRWIPGLLLRRRTHGIRPAQHLPGIADTRARGQPDRAHT